MYVCMLIVVEKKKSRVCVSYYSDLTREIATPHAVLRWQRFARWADVVRSGLGFSEHCQAVLSNFLAVSVWIRHSTCVELYMQSACLHRGL